MSLCLRNFSVFLCVLFLVACGSEQGHVSNTDDNESNFNVNDDDSCESNTDCDEHEYCFREAGCGLEGICQALECDDAETPFCDCQGETQISNDSCIQEPYDHLGECEEVVDPVSCESNEDCQEAEYCHRAPGCGLEGVCEPHPTDAECGEAETPYCDCEGIDQISPTTCVWAPYDHLGECEVEDVPESCETNADCDEASGKYCEREFGCGAPGVCEQIPLGETCLSVETAYCDCDGEIQISSTSCVYSPTQEMEFCEGPEPVSCERNSDCDELAGEYCERDPGCEGEGTCQMIPNNVGCGDMITPYCDCDGVQQESMDTCIWEPYDHEGQCEDPGDPLDPGSCEYNSDCNEGAGEYCNREPGCTEVGQCEQIPADVICSMVITPYCDCKGVQREAPSSCIWDAYKNQGQCTM